MSITPDELRRIANKHFIRTRRDSIRGTIRNALLEAAAELERAQAETRDARAEVRDCTANATTIIESLGKRLHAGERSPEQGAAPSPTKRQGRLPIFHRHT